MTQLSGSVALAIPTDRLSRELAVAVVGELDRVDFIGALADAVVRRMAGETGGSADQERVTDLGESVYDRFPEGTPDPGAGPRRGVAGFGGLQDDGTVTEET